jgi:hypothetical protein
VRLFRRTTIVLLLLAGAAACSSSGSSPTPSPSQLATEQLQQLAAKGLQHSYTGVYNLNATLPRGSATVLVRRTPTAYRISLERGRTVSVLIRNSHGTYSCQAVTGHHATCLFVARPGSPVPALFDAGQKLWSDYLIELSHNASAYLVTPAGTTAATATLPEGTCFAIAPGPTPSTNPVAPGTYCLTQDGIPTKAAFMSGTFTLRTIRPAPRPRELLPLAAPTPIPGLR